MLNFKPFPLRRRLVQAATVTLCSVAASGAALAQAWPAKSIKIVVGFAPGGTTDAMARVLAQSLAEALGQTVVVDNKPGVSGNWQRLKSSVPPRMATPSCSHRPRLRLPTLSCLSRPSTPRRISRLWPVWAVVRCTWWSTQIQD